MAFAGIIYRHVRTLNQKLHVRRTNFTVQPSCIQWNSLTHTRCTLCTQTQIQITNTKYSTYQIVDIAMYIHVCIYIDIVTFYFFLLFDLIITTTKNVNYKLDINNVLLFSFTEWELFRIIRNNRFLLLIDENYIMQIISLLKYDSCILIVEKKEKKKII